MAQKNGDCAICGDFELVADYGFHGEFICVDCTFSSEKLRNHVLAEIARRGYSKEFSDGQKEALDKISKH